MDSDLVKAARDLLDEVDAHLDDNADDAMAAAADALRDDIDETSEVDPGLGHALIDEVDALLDYEDDTDMGKAVEALREMLPPPSAVPGR